MSNYIARFASDRYLKVSQPLLSHRIDPFIREVEKRKGKNKGYIMSFVRGLRMSALIIYQLREILSDTDYSAYWGQIISEDGKYLSNECDILISKKGAFEKKWNGEGQENIMDFRFIRQEHVKLAISCKSFLTTSEVEKEYCENMKKYIDHVWLFAECCGPQSVELIQKIATEYGYGDFFYLYTWNRLVEVQATKLDENVWRNFEKRIRELVETE
jgi:hypothetical protein